MEPLREFFRKSIDYDGTDEEYNREVWDIAELAGDKGVDGMAMHGRYFIDRNDVERAWNFLHGVKKPKP